MLAAVRKNPDRGSDQARSIFCAVEFGEARQPELPCDGFRGGDRKAATIR